MSAKLPSNTARWSSMQIAPFLCGLNAFLSLIFSNRLLFLIFRLRILVLWTDMLVLKRSHSLLHHFHPVLTHTNILLKNNGTPIMQLCFHTKDHRILVSLNPSSRARRGFVPNLFGYVGHFIPLQCTVLYQKVVLRVPVVIATSISLRYSGFPF